MIGDELILAGLLTLLCGTALVDTFQSLGLLEATFLIIGITSILILAATIYWHNFSKYGKERRKRLETIRELPQTLLKTDENSIQMGIESDLHVPIFISDSIRSRHVHILGATGSGKTESVVLNFLKQDVERGLGAIILDAKGDYSFLDTLRTILPENRLKIFDLGSEKSCTYNPLALGTPYEAAQRLFSSLVWSEAYYKSKAFTALQRMFQLHYAKATRNPSLAELSKYLENAEIYSGFISTTGYSKSLAIKEFSELSGLRDQVKTLCIGHLAQILSPTEVGDMRLEEAATGKVLYFRLQSLLSPQLVTTIGRLAINHLNYLAGTAHRRERTSGQRAFIPTYLDEFASFACPEFADLISKARSAGYALHFSHQSIGDLSEVSEGFINRITDNSATKIVLRINDPDSAEFFARSFGTKLYQKATQRVTNSEEIDSAEIVGEGTVREAHQFRASPDLFKTLPTGMGSVLVAHGLETPHGASSVLKIRFPKLETTV